MGKNDITVYDIAREAGVSPATVSRVLTGNANVSYEKKKRIEEAIRKHDFQPNAIARSLSKKESKVIGLILPNITNPFFSSMFIEIEKCALEAGYTMMICDSMNSRELESMYLRSLSEKQVDAIVFMGGRINDVKTKPKYAEEMTQVMKRVPIVLVNGKMTGVDCYKVVTDEEQGIIDAVEYLLSLGHSKIGMLGGVKSITSTRIKHDAFKKALKKNEIELNSDWIITEDYSIESGANCMRELLKGDSLPTAIICINDFVGMGVIQEAKKAGLKIPEDISIVGYDGTYLSEFTEPPLTTVSQSYQCVGRAVMDTILDVINKRDTEKTKKIKTSLIIRNSCGKI